MCAVPLGALCMHGFDLHVLMRFYQYLDTQRRIVTQELPRGSEEEGLVKLAF